MSTVALAGLFATATPEAAYPLSTSGQRYAQWQKDVESMNLLPNEQLLPQILVRCDDVLPPFMQHSPAEPSEQLRAQMDALAPWDFWFQLAAGIESCDNNVTKNRMLCRSQLISETVAKLLGEKIGQSHILDMGSHSGFFSFDMAGRGAASVTGVELRTENLAQANFLKDVYQLPQVTFQQGNVNDFKPNRTYEVVLNLGLLYHVIDPISLVRQTYELCSEFAVIDTLCHKEPISAYIAAFNKDTAGRGEGTHTAEMHPTYRALIDTMHDAGFVDLIELTAHDGDKVAGIYKERRRRCIIGFKKPLAEFLQQR